MKGTLHYEVHPDEGPRVRVSPEDGGKTRTVSANQLDRRLKALYDQDPALLNGQIVEYETKGGIKDVRPAGEAIERQVGTVQSTPPSARPANEDRPRGEFHNPYNFVPTMTRHLGHADLGDGEGAALDRFHEDRWTGRLHVTITTATPLLIPDAARATGKKDEHLTFPLRLGLDNRPHMPATAFKGMLRSAFEAVTNSRLRCFQRARQPARLSKLGQQRLLGCPRVNHHQRRGPAPGRAFRRGRPPGSTATASPTETNRSSLRGYLAMQGERCPAQRSPMQMAHCPPTETRSGRGRRGWTREGIERGRSQRSPGRPPSLGRSPQVLVALS